MSSAIDKKISGTSYTILFAPGMDEGIKNLSRTLINAATSLYTAESGREALELLHKEHPSLIIAALDLGDMTGFEFCARVREADAGNVVVLIGREGGEQAYRKALEAGAARYLILDEAAANLESVITTCCSISSAGHERMAQLAVYRSQAEILLNLPLAVALLAPGGSILFANRTFAQLTGIKGDCAGISLGNLLHSLPSTDPERGWHHLVEAANSGREWSDHIVCQSGRDTTVHIQASLTRFAPATNAVPTSQKTPQLLLILTDTSADQKQLRRLTAQRDSAIDLLELQRSAEADLSSMQQMLAQLCKGELPPGKYDLAQALVHELQSIETKVKDLGHIALLLGTQNSAADKPFSLGMLITSLQNSLVECFRKRKVELSCKIPSYIPDLYTGDQLAVRYVLHSLLSNALEVCDGDNVTLTADVKEKRIDSFVIQFSVAFSCSDVPHNRFESMHDYLGRIDQQQLLAEARSVTAGLSLAASLVDRLGGKIWVKSSAKQGLSFCFTVGMTSSSLTQSDVLDDKSATAELQGQHDSYPHKPDGIAIPTRILLADDSQIDQHTIRNLLEGFGCQITCVANGLEAVEEFDCATYDLVLMDILMPEMGGFEATRLIREKERVLGTHTPIIALTAYSLKAVYDKCVTVGMNGYLSKPVSKEEIEKLFSGISLAESFTPLVPNNGELPLLDVHGTIVNLGGNNKLYLEIVDLFIEKAPLVLAELLAAIHKGNREEVVQHSHKLKGMAANIGAKRFAELSRKIQDNSQVNNLEDAASWLDALPQEYERLQSAIAAFHTQKLL